MKYVPVIILLFFLTGCATTQYGNYVEDNSSTHNAVIATDAAYQLTQLYPPASTTFNMQHPTEDSFGSAFMERLRGGGFAIKEHVKTNPGQSAPDNTPVENGDITLAYILDQSSDVYRLSVMIDEQILTRAYTPYEDQLVPGGSWVFKE